MANDRMVLVCPCCKGYKAIGKRIGDGWYGGPVDLDLFYEEHFLKCGLTEPFLFLSESGGGWRYDLANDRIEIEKGISNAI